MDAPNKYPNNSVTGDLAIALRSGKERKKESGYNTVKETHNAEHVLGAVLLARLCGGTVSPSPLWAKSANPAPWVAPVWPPSPYSAPEGGLHPEDTRAATEP